MKEKNIKDFKKDLAELLEKYDATIEFACGESSDTHGIYAAKMVVCFNKLEHKLSDGWVIYPHDIK